MIKKSLLMILVLILFCSFVHAATYRIDEGDDGDIEYVIPNVNDLRWRVFFVTWGSQQGPYTDNSNLPRLTVFNGSNTIINFTSHEQYSAADIPSTYQKDWFAVWEINLDGEFINWPSYTGIPSTQELKPGNYSLEVFAYGNALTQEVIDFWPPSGDTCNNFNIETCPNYCKGPGIGPNACSWNNDVCGWLCNGIHVYIRFYDGGSYLSWADIRSTNWPGDKFTDTTNGLVWLTDSDPSYVNVKQTLNICEDECSIAETGCSGDNLSSWTCILGLDNCYDKFYTVCSAGQICQIDTCVSKLTGAYWADMAGNQIIEVNLSDRVMLVVPGTELTGENITYRIYKTVPWWFDEKEAQFSSAGFTTWIANESGEDYYFEAEITGTGEIRTSGFLKITEETENSPPVVNILSPEMCEIYFTDEEINFTQNSYDVDDNIIVEWDFGDGSIVTEYNTTYNFSSAGQKNILLTLTDERGAVTDDLVTILIVDPSLGDGEQYICGQVSEPEWGKNTIGLDIYFNATESYAIEANGCGGSVCNTIDCLAGRCKDRPDITLQNSPNWDGFETLDFSWTFDDQTSFNEKGTNGSVFTKIFGVPGDHWAKLNVSINPSGSTEVKFSTSFMNICREIDSVLYWWDSFGEKLNPLSDKGACVGLNGVPDGANKGDDCCPPEYQCETEGANWESICNISTSNYCQNKTFCSDYLTQDECLNDTYTCQIAQSYPGSSCGKTIGVDAICGADSFTSKSDDCKCEWNGTSCIHESKLWSGVYDEPVIHTCEETTDHGECIDGVMNVRSNNILRWNETYIANLTATVPSNPPSDYPECGLSSPPTCTSTEIENYLDVKCSALKELCGDFEGVGLCGKSSIKLTFFTLRNLIIAICLVVIIYIWIKRKK